MADVVVANNPSPRMLPTLPDISRGTFRAEQERTIAPHRRGNRERRSHIPQLHSQAPPLLPPLGASSAAPFAGCLQADVASSRREILKCLPSPPSFFVII